MAMFFHPNIENQPYRCHDRVGTKCYRSYECEKSEVKGQRSRNAYDPFCKRHMVYWGFFLGYVKP
eukprot:UN05818